MSAVDILARRVERATELLYEILGDLDERANPVMEDTANRIAVVIAVLRDGYDPDGVGSDGQE